MSIARTWSGTLASRRGRANCCSGPETPTTGDLAGGAFVPTGLIVGASNHSYVAREEIFGPILTVIPFDTPERAAGIANDSPFGLVAGVHTTNINAALSMAERLRVAQVWINAFYVGWTSNSRSAATSCRASAATRGWRRCRLTSR